MPSTSEWMSEFKYCMFWWVRSIVCHASFKYTSWCYTPKQSPFKIQNHQHHVEINEKNEVTTVGSDIKQTNKKKGYCRKILIKSSNTTSVSCFKWTCDHSKHSPSVHLKAPLASGQQASVWTNYWMHYSTLESNCTATTITYVKTLNIIFNGNGSMLWLFFWFTVDDIILQ